MAVQHLIEELTKAGLTVSVAESCTGGQLQSSIVAVPGASKVFFGGVVAYRDETKQAFVDVPKDVLAIHGAVSAATAEAMASGVRSRTGSDMGIGITGIAGPDGGTLEKPVGTVWIAVHGPGDDLDVKRFGFTGNRNEIRASAVSEAIDMALEELEEWVKESV